MLDLHDVERRLLCKNPNNMLIISDKYLYMYCILKNLKVCGDLHID